MKKTIAERIIPGDRPSINSENSPLLEAGLVDSGRGQSLLTNYFTQRKDLEIGVPLEESLVKEENKDLRAKIKEIETSHAELKEEIRMLRMENDRLKKTLIKMVKLD